MTADAAINGEPVVRGRPGLTGVEKLRRLRRAYPDLDGEALIRAVAGREFPGRAAVASSFGTESAVLLALVARVDPAMPVLFLDTGMLFAETLDYVEQLRAHLGLANILFVRPDAAIVAHNDPDRDLWLSDADKCCYIRKVRPFRTALHHYDCWLSGLKRAHGGVRGDVETIELEEGRIKLNPLARWSAERIEAAFAEDGLPRHPLAARGYRSIGCIPCTRAARPGEDARAGRWDGRGKSECGIHSRLFARSKVVLDGAEAEAEPEIGAVAPSGE